MIKSIKFASGGAEGRSFHKAEAVFTQTDTEKHNACLSLVRIPYNIKTNKIIKIGAGGIRSEEVQTDCWGEKKVCINIFIHKTITRKGRNGAVMIIGFTIV